MPRALAVPLRAERFGELTFGQPMAYSSSSTLCISWLAMLRRWWVGDVAR
jgi:hypothetical protein